MKKLRLPDEQDPNGYLPFKRRRRKRNSFKAIAVLAAALLAQSILTYCFGQIGFGIGIAVAVAGLVYFFATFNFDSTSGRI